MITTKLVQTLADYNKWQNASIYAAADSLTEVDRKADRGAFWSSIEATLNHVLWGDRLWMSRLGDEPQPRAKSMRETVFEGGDWNELKQARAALDSAISAWAGCVAQAHLDSSITYVSAVTGGELTHNVGLLTIHMFNHQTHHRGQVHALLTAAGAIPQDTDIPFMPGLMTS